MNAFTFKRVGFAVAVLFTGVAGDASGQVQYTVTDLGTLPGGEFSVAAGVNDSGQDVSMAFNNFHTFDRYLPGIMSMRWNDVSAEDAVGLCEAE